MKIVTISGGLGNQMFQYAFALALKVSLNEEILLNNTGYSLLKQHNGYELERLFDVIFPIASISQIKKVSRYIPHYKLSRVCRKFLPNKKSEVIEVKNTYDLGLLNMDGDKLYEGTWQHFQYFEDIKNLVKEKMEFKLPLSQKNKETVEKFNREKTVSLHIRRGDYLNDPDYMGICELDYYVRAIKYIKTLGSDYSFAIFSNDINWCKQHIIPLFGDSQYTIVDWNTGNEGYNDIRLMEYCDVNVIANSSFSWWAAYLNKKPNSITIAPKVWTNNKKYSQAQYPSWILM